jgi:hypothetical protein
LTRIGRDPTEARTLLPTHFGPDVVLCAERLGGLLPHNTPNALVLSGEISPDGSRFPTAKRFASSLGLCPPNRSSVGRIRNRRLPRRMNRTVWLLRMAAQGCYQVRNLLRAF